jgi:hypothetical protein
MAPVSHAAEVNARIVDFLERIVEAAVRSSGRLRAAA